MVRKFNTFILTVLCIFIPNGLIAGTLFLLIDVSNSISEEQLELQISAYRYAMSDMVFLDHTRIEVITFSANAIHLSSGSRLDAYSAFSNYQRTIGATCLELALFKVEQLLPRLTPPFILDISGDGFPNCYLSEEVPNILDRLAEHGVRVNTLLLTENVESKEDRSSLLQYYSSLTRNNGFSMVIDTNDHFLEAIYNKIVMEVATILK